jgi:hypothetical protein
MTMLDCSVYDRHWVQCSSTERRYEFNPTSGMMMDVIDRSLCCSSLTFPHLSGLLVGPYCFQLELLCDKQVSLEAAPDACR